MQRHITEHPSVEFLVLADHVEVLNGKLYMMGAGWDSIAVQNFQAGLNLNIALSIIVPWEATEASHIWSLSVQTGDGSTVATVNGNIGATRNAFLPEGASQRVMNAVALHLHLPGPGAYAVVADVDGGESKSLSFRATPTAPAAGAARA